jgi:predicted enzyme related to lactoylglutathione lyase
MDYWLVMTGPKDQPGIDGGLVPRQGEIDGQAVIAFVCTIDVPDIDETVSNVEKNGGTIAVPKMAVPTVGWLVYFKDTEGNIFGAMQTDPEAK